MLEVDYYDKAMGAVLTQEQNPLAYLSKAFTSKHKGFSTYDKEVPTVVLADSK